MMIPGAIVVEGGVGGGVELRAVCSADVRIRCQVLPCVLVQYVLRFFNLAPVEQYKKNSRGMGWVFVCVATGLTAPLLIAIVEMTPVSLFS